MSADTEAVHGLIHRSGGPDRLVPACLCGWWSPDGSHWRFERRLRDAQNDGSGAS